MLDFLLVFQPIYLPKKQDKRNFLKLENIALSSSFCFDLPLSAILIFLKRLQLHVCKLASFSIEFFHHTEGFSMRIILYNIRYGTGTEWNYHLPVPFSGCLRRTYGRFRAITEYISNLSPDIVCLVEADSGSPRQSGVSQPEMLAGELGGQSVFASKYGENAFASRVPFLNCQGNAVASKLPVLSSKEHYLTRGFKRTLLEVEFERFNLFLMHLPLGHIARKSQLQEIAHICSDSKKPVVLAGDGNTYTGRKEIVPLMTKLGLKSVDMDFSPTYPSRSPVFFLDMVLCSSSITVKNTFVPKVSFSDHLPVVCDLEMPE